MNAPIRAAHDGLLPSTSVVSVYINFDGVIEFLTPGQFPLEWVGGRRRRPSPRNSAFGWRQLANDLMLPDRVGFVPFILKFRKVNYSLLAQRGGDVTSGHFSARNFIIWLRKRKICGH